MKKFQKLLVLGILFTGTLTYAQNKINGVIYDSTTKTAIEGAEFVIKGTTNGTYSENNGSFTLTTELIQGQAQVSYLGYQTKTVNFNFNGANEINLGTIYINQDDQSLDEIVIMARGVIDVADGRKTPIAVSTIKGIEIEEKVGTGDITKMMVNTPSVYVTSESSGFGDTQMYTRGFHQSNAAFLLNGQPINGMEDGNMYWSNWSGMSDIANAIQIQRGLGSSKLAISSVGGTINFITKATEMRAGGFIKGMVANDNYFKTTVGGNTGLLDNGWGVSALFSHWQGDGYNDMTAGQGQNYFVSIGYKANEKHNFNFLITGAPQWHDQNYAKRISDYQTHGLKYNNNWGMLNGEKFNIRKNYYHKPVMNLNWDWKIDETSNLSTVVYASFGRGGGTGNEGPSFKSLEDGTLNLQSVFDQNVIDGAGKTILRSSVNNHSWFGVVSNYQKKFNDNLTWNAGIDLRTYSGEHFKQMANDFGASYFTVKNNVRLGEYNVTDVYSTNPWKALNNYAKDGNQRIGWDYSETINYGGVFTQLEYATDDFSAFFQGAVSNQSHVRYDNYQYAEGNDKSDKVNNVGYNIKGGASYKFNDNHMVFGNAGIYSRQPFHDNIYLNFKNDVNPFTKNEDIVGLELGYKFTSEFVAVNVNAYQTTWANRVESNSSFANASQIAEYDPTGDLGLTENSMLYFVNRGVKQQHRGIEIDVQAKPLYNLDITGFASIGDWVYKGSAIQEIRDEDRNLLGVKQTDLDGGKVGNAAQTVFGLGAKYKILPNLSIDANYRYYQDLFADVQAKDNLELPSYQLVDAGVSYRLNLTKSNAISFRVNVNNVFDAEYITQSRTAIQNVEGASTYKGINTANQVYFGFGRTWNASVKFTF